VSIQTCPICFQFHGNDYGKRLTFEHKIDHNLNSRDVSQLLISNRVSGKFDDVVET